MGVSLTFSFLALARGRQPDWAAAERAIEDLELATVYNTGDEFFPLEGWLDDGPEPPAARGVHALLRHGGDYLASAMHAVRDAMHNGHPDLAVVDLPDHHVFMAGGLTAGDSPSELLDDFAVFSEGGLARAAGFDAWTEWCLTRPEDRRLRFADDEARCVDAVHVFVRAEELARRGGSRASIRAGEPEQWAAAADALLDRVIGAGRGSAVAALLDFAAWLWALIDVLHTEAGLEELPDGETPSGYVLELLEPSFAPARRRRTADAAARRLRRRFAPYAPLLPALRGRGDVATARAVVEDTGLPLPRALAVELTAAVLVDALFDLADLGSARPARTGTSADEPQSPIEPQALATGPPLSIPWMAIRSFGHDAAHAVTVTAPSSQRPQLEQDLRQWQEILRGAWNSMTDHEAVGDVTLWLADDGRHPGDWSPGEAIRRLGAAGVLDAAGVVGWGAGATPRKRRARRS